MAMDGTLHEHRWTLSQGLRLAMKVAPRGYDEAVDVPHQCLCRLDLLPGTFAGVDQGHLQVRRRQRGRRPTSWTRTCC